MRYSEAARLKCELVQSEPKWSRFNPAGVESSEMPQPPEARS